MKFAKSPSAETADFSISEEYAPDISGAPKLEEGKAAYPQIQITNYKPANLFDKVEFCFSEDSYKTVADCQLIGELNLKPVEVCFPDAIELSEVQAFGNPIKIVLLGYPKNFGYNKDTKKYFNLKIGNALGEKEVTAARLYCAIVTPKGLLTKEEVDSETGEVFPVVQVFTLRLTSLRTAIIGYKDDKKDAKTFYKLNAALCNKRGVTGQWLTPFYSVPLEVILERFTGKKSGKSSDTFNFRLGSAASPLSKEDVDLVKVLLADKEFVKRVSDPFNLNNGDAVTDAYFDEVTEF